MYYSIDLEWYAEKSTMGPRPKSTCDIYFCQVHVLSAPFRAEAWALACLSYSLMTDGRQKFGVRQSWRGAMIGTLAQQHLRRAVTTTCNHRTWRLAGASICCIWHVSVPVRLIKSCSSACFLLGTKGIRIVVGL